MRPKVAGFILHKILGWKSEGGMVPEKRVVFLAVPHTSIWDCAIGYLYFRELGGRLKIMIKKEAFFWPANWLLRSLGGFPVDRSHSASLMKSLIREMNSSDTFYLAICPEGTRHAVKRWKTGYHTIATETGCPVYLTYFDWKEKRVGIGPRFELTDDARADTDRVQAIYEEMHLHAKFPEGYVTH